MARFQHYQFTFTANTATTNLKFSDLGTGNSERRYDGRHRLRFPDGSRYTDSDTDTDSHSDANADSDPHPDSQTHSDPDSHDSPAG